MLGKTGLSGFNNDTWLHHIYPLMTYDWSNITFDKVERLIKDEYIYLQNDFGVYSDGAWDQIILIKNNTIFDTDDNTNNTTITKTVNDTNDCNNNNNDGANDTSNLDIIIERDQVIERLQDEVKKMNNLNKAFYAMYSDLEAKYDSLAEYSLSAKRSYQILLKAIAIGKSHIAKYSRNKVTYIILSSVFEDKYVDRGPIILSTLPYYDEFTAFDTRLAEDTNIIETTTPYFKEGMIPSILMPYMNYDPVKHSQIWSQQLIDTAINLAKERADFSPEYYKYSALDFYSTFAAYPIDNKKVLVHNSICPWIEAIVISHNALEVTTWAQSDIVSQSNLIKVLKPIDVLEDYKEYFDVVVSFSNINREGLGRDGEIINPFGDFAAMTEINSILKDNGILFLGIPVASIGYVNGNLWRSYSKQRLTTMVEASGFKIIDVIQDHYPYYDNPNITNINGLLSDWQNIPLIMLQKKVTLHD